MRIVLYNSSSFGGCFEYGKELSKAYARHPNVESVSWWVPVNASVDQNIPHRKLFLTDKPKSKSKWAKQLHFLWRVFVNPILLGLHIRKEPASVLIFNDFEQLSAFVWVPLFRYLFAQKHQPIIILHDPDRDAYPPSLRFSAWSMKKILGLMNVAFYHNYLPDKPYYKNLPSCRFVDIPHGYYSLPKADENLVREIEGQKKPGLSLLGILGNIREEKNYDLAIEALVELPHFQLLIAGSAANARVQTEGYRKLAHRLEVADRIIWIERYLTEAELAACIAATDLIWLNYAPSFTSQSGILNIIAPFRKRLIASDGKSSLSVVIQKFGLGTLVEANNKASVVEKLSQNHETSEEQNPNWDNYLAYASWENHVKLAIGVFIESAGKG